MLDRRNMELAIAMAEHCAPKDLDRDPKVGAVIVIGDSVIATGYRGDEDHAEKLALSRVPAGVALTEATIYTTLEPCTRDVRTRTLESCTDLLVAAQLRKVVIGILDPNQGVCGKGVVRLQQNKIEVALFPHDLAQRILRQNERFVRAQQTLGIRIIDPKSGTVPEVPLKQGKYLVKCECNNSLGDDVIAIVSREGAWWPQSSPLRQIGDTNEWEVEINFGAAGLHTIHIVKANELGAQMISFYRKIVNLNRERRRQLTGKLDDKYFDLLHSDYPGIEMPKLPKGLDLQAISTVNVV